MHLLDESLGRLDVAVAGVAMSGIGGVVVGVVVDVVVGVVVDGVVVGVVVGAQVLASVAVIAGKLVA